MLNIFYFLLITNWIKRSIKVKKTMKSKESSLLYRKIDALGLSALDRAEAMAALEVASLIVDMLAWVAGKFERVAIALAPKPTLKHQ
jgi:hypothetical protein